MNALHPMIEQLADARDDEARADWLVRCPLGDLLKYQDTIRNRLRVAGFLAGVDYVDAACTTLRAVRRSDRQVAEDLGLSRGRLWWALGRDLGGAGADAP